MKSINTFLECFDQAIKSGEPIYISHNDKSMKLIGTPLSFLRITSFNIELMDSPPPLAFYEREGVVFMNLDPETLVKQPEPLPPPKLTRWELAAEFLRTFLRR